MTQTTPSGLSHPSEKKKCRTLIGQFLIFLHFDSEKPILIGQKHAISTHKNLQVSQKLT
jgi:hypothetical protein